MLRSIVNQILDPSVHVSARATVASFIQRVKRKQAIQKLLDYYAVRNRGKTELNVVLIVVDCLRWDHTSLADYARNTTPFLKEIAQNGTAFTECYAPAPWTYPSVLSLLTGFYPHNHSGVYRHDPRNFDNHEKEGYPGQLRDDILLLPEVLHRFGYQTLFISDVGPALIAVQNREPNHLFYHKDKVNPAKLLRAVDLRRQFFLYVHLGNLHTPVHIPEKFQRIFDEMDMSVSDLRYREWSYRYGDIDEQGFVEYKENRTKLYDTTLRFVDYLVESLVIRIQEESDRETLFVITADHGEELWDHAKIEKELFYDPRGYWGIGHGHNLFQEVVRVPLIFSKRISESGTVVGNISTIDIFPTILELLSIDHEIPCDGRSLLSSETKRTTLSEEVAYGYEKKAIIKGSHKLIVSEGDGVSLLFDLERDPEEKEQINDHALKELLLDELNSMVAIPQPTKTLKQEITFEMEKRLRELGYM